MGQVRDIRSLLMRATKVAELRGRGHRGKSLTPESLFSHPWTGNAPTRRHQTGTIYESGVRSRHCACLTHTAATPIPRPHGHPPPSTGEQQS